MSLSNTKERGGSYEQEAVDAGLYVSERGCRRFIWNDRPLDRQREGSEGSVGRTITNQIESYSNHQR
jgi:hypothetical protein